MVCAYARVSTSSDEQENSYAAQVDYYQKFIQPHAGWEFAGIYADEGIAGTSTKHRIVFNKTIGKTYSARTKLSSKSICEYCDA